MRAAAGRPSVIALATALACLLLIAVPVQATAADAPPCRRGCQNDPPPPGSAGGSEAEGIWASLSIAGDATGGTRFSRSGQVKVAPRCWYRWWFTGREYATQLSSQSYQRALAQMPPEYRSTPLPDWQQYADKDADHGGWYGPWCREGVDTTYLLTYVAAHPPRYFEASEPRPSEAIDIDPQALAEAAYEAMDLPRGTIRWNPSLHGTGATVVNLPTWVWVEDAARTATVRAQVDSGPWAQVEAVIADVTVSADNADTTSCGTDLGVPWSSAQDTTGTTCQVVFHRSSANLPTKPGQPHPTATMTVSTTWTASWTSWLDPTPVDLGTQTTTVSTEVPVAEIQTVVTRTGRSAGAGRPDRP